MTKRIILTLVILSSVMLFFNLGKKSFWEPDEGRYAEISREMVETGDWLTPRLNYIKHFDKPPVTYWLIGSSFKLLGQSEFSGHLPLVIFALAGVIACFFLGRSLFGIRTGFLAAVILITSLGYPALGRILSTDIIFSVFCLFCYLFFIRKNYLLFYLFMALGFMTKGPVIFVITLLPICVFLIYERQTRIFKEMHWGRGLLLFTLIALPWYAYQISHNPGLLYDWFFQHTLNRIVRANTEAFYFFVPVLIGLFFPWVFFLAAAVKGRLSFKRTPPDQEPAKILLLFLWFIIPFIFFSCIGKKLIPYILPLLAPLAIITARFWNEAMKRPKLLSARVVAASYYTFLSFTGILFLGITVFLLGRFDYRLGVEVGRLSIILMSVIMAGTMAMSLFFFKSKKVAQLFATIAISSCLFFLTVIDLLPKIEANTNKSIKALALKIKEDLKPEDKIVNYRCFLKGLPFYLKKRTIVVERERSIVYEKTDHWRDYLLKDSEEMYRLFSLKDFRVFCITYTWEFKKIKEEYPEPLYLLGQAGKYVLFSSRKTRE